MEDNEWTTIKWLEVLAIVIAAMVLMALCGCKSVEYVPIVVEKTDTTYITKEKRDSIVLHDSVYVHEWSRNDTVYVGVTKWKKEYVYTERVDTFYQSKVDSIPYPVEVTKEVERDYTWWDKMRFYMAYALIGVVIIYLSIKR